MKASVKTKAITELLRDKHAADVCVPECKTGPSWGSGECLRMDVWTMARSWANAKTTCYEVKVNRNDFMRDDKWRGYLPYCNAFYFVCPSELITVDEVPAEAGLMWASKNFARLYTKKKAPFRDVEIPEPLWRYILMSRTDVRYERDWSNSDTEDTAAYWKEWLAKKEENREIGHRVARELSKMYHEQVTRVSRDNERLEKENKRLQMVEKILDKLDISSYTASTESGFIRALKRANIGVPRSIQYALDGMIRNATILKDQLAQELDADATT